MEGREAEARRGQGSDAVVVSSISGVGNPCGGTASSETAPASSSDLFAGVAGLPGACTTRVEGQHVVLIACLEDLLIVLITGVKEGETSHGWMND